MDVKTKERQHLSAKEARENSKNSHHAENECFKLIETESKKGNTSCSFNVSGYDEEVLKNLIQTLKDKGYDVEHRISCNVFLVISWKKAK